jgi:thioredoxin-dependent peroxiredoxin
MRRLLSLIALCFVTATAWAAGPTEGQKAPDFRLQDQKGDWHTLETEKGKWLVMYFYPKDFTAGCTTEVCTFRDDIVKLHAAGAVVLGVSLDDVKSHAEFAKKYHVPFPLLSDPNGAVATKYAVLTSKGDMKYAMRETFLIDPAGKIVKVYKDVDPEKNSGQVLADLAELKKAGA